MPLAFEYKTPDGGILAGWDLSEPSEDLFASVNLTPEEIITYHSFRVEKRRREWLASRRLIQQYTDIHSPVQYHPSGRPFINGCQLSISHTNGLAVVAIHPTHPVTVDVETITPRVAKVASRFINPNEAKMIDPTNQLTWQTLIWCAKEALFKYWDETEIDFKEHLHVLPFTINTEQPFIIETIYNKHNIEKQLTLSATCNNALAMVYLL